MILDKLVKKSSGNKQTDCKISYNDFQDLKREIEALQRSVANLRQDTRQIVRDEIKFALDQRIRRYS